MWEGVKPKIELRWSGTWEDPLEMGVRPTGCNPACRTGVPNPGHDPAPGHGLFGTGLPKRVQLNCVNGGQVELCART